MKNCQQQIRYWLPPVFLLLILILGCDEPATTDSNEPEEKIEYLVGESYFGRNNYIQYKVGNLPLIIAAPHGGSEKPEEIPDRSWGSTVKDAYTLEMARALADSLNALTGKQVHLITCLLHRSKLDANRDLDEAAQGNGYAGTAWTEYHNFINVAKEKVTEEFGHGLYIDLHGQSRRPRIELGYLLDDVDLMLPDSVLDEPLYVEKSSLRALAEFAPGDFSSILRGDFSLGNYLSSQGYPTVPSITISHPGEDGYFRGGYNTVRHGSRDSGTISAVQIELYKEGIRDSSENRARFAGHFTLAVHRFFKEFFALDLSSRQ